MTFGLSRHHFGVARGLPYSVSDTRRDRYASPLGEVDGVTGKTGAAAETRLTTKA